MIGSIRWNFVIGMIAMILTFCISISHNLFLTSFIHSIYSFITLFALSFLFRWMLGTVVGLNRIDLQADDHNSQWEKQKGHHVDVKTPEEDGELQQLLKPNVGAAKSAAFSPLNPPKLASTDKMDPQDLANVIRHMSQE